MIFGPVRAVDERVGRVGLGRHAQIAEEIHDERVARDPPQRSLDEQAHDTHVPVPDTLRRPGRGPARRPSPGVAGRSPRAPVEGGGAFRYLIFMLGGRAPVVSSSWRRRRGLRALPLPGGSRAASCEVLRSQCTPRRALATLAATYRAHLAAKAAARHGANEGVVR